MRHTNTASPEDEAYKHCIARRGGIQLVHAESALHGGLTVKGAGDLRTLCTHGVSVCVIRKNPHPSWDLTESSTNKQPVHKGGQIMSLTIPAVHREKRHIRTYGRTDIFLLHQPEQ